MRAIRDNVGCVELTSSDKPTKQAQKHRLRTKPVGSEENLGVASSLLALHLGCFYHPLVAVRWLSGEDGDRSAVQRGWQRQLAKTRSLFAARSDRRTPAHRLYSRRVLVERR